MLGPGRACAQYQKNVFVTENLPIPHPKHKCCNRALEHNVQANFSKFWWSSLPIRGIRSCGIEALSNLAPHLEQLHVLLTGGRDVPDSQARSNDITSNENYIKTNSSGLQYQA